MNPDTIVLRYCIVLLVAIIGYFIVLRRFADFVLPYRIRMADLGGKILASGASPRRAAQIEFYLDNAFSGWVMAVAIFVFWIAAFSGMRKYCFKRFSLKEQSNIEDNKMAVLFLASAFAANPLCGVVFAVECAVFAFIVVVLAGQSAMVAAASEFIRLETVLLGPSKKHQSETVCP